MFLINEGNFKKKIVALALGIFGQNSVFPKNTKRVITKPGS